MTWTGYSQTFIDECQKTSGEALAAKVHIRRLSVDNIWVDDSVAEKYHNAVKTVAGEYQSPSVENTNYNTGHTVYKLFNNIIYPFGYLEYDIPPEIFTSTESILFSIYVHSDSITTSVYPLKLYIINGTKSTESTAEWNTEAGSFVPYQNTPELTVTTTVVGDGWTRLSIGREFGLGESDDDFAIKIRHCGDYNGQLLYYSCAQLEYPTTSAGESLTPKRYYPGTANQTRFPGVLEEFSTSDRILSVGSLTRKKERDFGVVQGGRYQFSVVNMDSDGDIYKHAELMGAACTVQVGFPTLDKWGPVSSGHISKITANDKLNMTIEIDDSMMKTIKDEIPRDIYFDTVGYCSDFVTTNIKGNDSAEYDNEEGSVTVTYYEQHLIDEKLIMKFDTPSSFKILTEDGTDLYEDSKASFPITEDASFGSSKRPDIPFITVSRLGWSVADNAYAVDDEFFITTSKKRTTEELTPIGMIMHIVNDLAGIKVYDVIGGDYLDSPLYDLDNWNDALNDLDNKIFNLTGLWKAGSKYVDIIQDTLKTILGSMYVMENGQFAIYMPSPLSSSDDALILNGNPESGAVTIMSINEETDIKDYCDSITVKYLNPISGEEVDSTVFKAIKSFAASNKTITTKWRVNSLGIKNLLGLALYKYSTKPMKTYRITAPLYAMIANIDTPLIISDDFIGVTDKATNVVTKTVNIYANTVDLECNIDSLQDMNIAIVGSAEIPGSKCDDEYALIW